MSERTEFSGKASELFSALGDGKHMGNKSSLVANNLTSEIKNISNSIINFGSI